MAHVYPGLQGDGQNTEAAVQGLCEEATGQDHRHLSVDQPGGWRGGIGTNSYAVETARTARRSKLLPASHRGVMKPYSCGHHVAWEESPANTSLDSGRRHRSKRWGGRRSYLFYANTMLLAGGGPSPIGQNNPFYHKNQLGTL